MTDCRAIPNVALHKAGRRAGKQWDHQRKVVFQRIVRERPQLTSPSWSRCVSIRCLSSDYCSIHKVAS